MSASEPTPSNKSSGARRSSRTKKNVFVTRSLVLANAAILQYIASTKYKEFSDNVFWIESTRRRCGNVGTEPLELADANIKQAIDTFAGFIKKEIAAQTSQLPSSMQIEIKQQRSLVAPTEVRWYSKYQDKLLDTLEDADRLLVLIDGAIVRNLIDVPERTRIESRVRRAFKDLSICSWRAQNDFRIAILPNSSEPVSHGAGSK